MLERGKLDRGVVEIVDTESLVPAEHLLRKIDAAVDFNRVYEMVEALYSEDNGRPSVDPVVLFKMVLIQHLYGLPSLRRTAEEVNLNVAYRWFLGYTLQEETPHFSTVSYNFRHRFTTETVDRVFAWILEEVAEAGYLSPKAVFIDGSHIKADAAFRAAFVFFLPYQSCPWEETEFNFSTSEIILSELKESLTQPQNKVSTTPNLTAVGI